MKLPAYVLFRKDLSLMVWKPHGILDQALVNEIVAFVVYMRLYWPKEEAKSGKWTAPKVKKAE